MKKNNHKHERVGKKLKKGSDKPMRAQKISKIINSVNQQNLKMNNAKSKEQST
jgi:hypothetical protein